MAPEMVAANSSGYNKSVDWWALGVIMFEMLTGEPPFRSRNSATLLKLIVTQRLKLPPYVVARGGEKGDPCAFAYDGRMLLIEHASDELLGVSSMSVTQTNEAER